MGAYDWTGNQGRRWAAAGDRLEGQLAPVSDALFTAAALQPGERVLDVGCGRGSTTRRAAEAVLPGGSVTGFDVSAMLLDDARRLTDPDAPYANAITWVEGNAEEDPLGEGEYDVVMSRFGVMFFDNPTAAFANILKFTKVGGRLVMAVWQTRSASPVMQRCLDTAAPAAAALGVTLEFPGPDEGPFSLGTPEAVQATLGGAGWANISIDNQELTMYSCGPGSVDEIVDTSVDLGALARALDPVTPEVKAAVRQAIVEDFTALHDGTGVPLIGAISLLTATRP